MTSTPHQRSAPAWSLALWIRKIHTYAGALFAPAIVFFAITGGLQVYHLHRNQPASGYRAPALIQLLGVLHKDQLLKAPKAEPDAPAGGGAASGASLAPGAGGGRPHRAHRAKDGDAPAQASGQVQPATATAPPPAAPRPQGLAQTLLKAYVAVMAASLTLTSLLGLYLGLQSRRERMVVAVLLALGVVIPVALLLV